MSTHESPLPRVSSTVAPQQPRPLDEIILRVYPDLATVLAGTESDTEDRQGITRAAAVEQLVSLGHDVVAIEWALHLGLEKGLIRQAIPTEGDRTEQLPELHLAPDSRIEATDAFWERWGMGTIKGGFLLGLSGGGIRATLFQLGACVHFDEIQRLQYLKGVVSVSGGSILAAHLLKYWKRATEDHQGFLEVAASLVRFTRSNIRNRVLVPWVWSRLMPWRWRRSWGRAFRLEWAYRTHFGETTIRDLDAPVLPRLAIVAADPERNERIAFTADGVLRFDLDGHKPSRPETLIAGPLAGGIRLSLAVAASSCFPFVFPRMHLKCRDLALTFSEFKGQLALIDGGVGDNLGVAVLLGLRFCGKLTENAILLVDAERPLTSRPSSIIGPGEISMQGNALSDLARKLIQADPRSHCRPICLAERTKTYWLSFETQAQLMRFRTDLDAPSWQEIQALLLHGAAVAGEAIPGPSMKQTRAKELATINKILDLAGCPKRLGLPSPVDLKSSHRRPIVRLAVHVALMLLVVGVALWVGIAGVRALRGKPSRDAFLIAHFDITFDGKRPDPPWLTDISPVDPLPGDKWCEPHLSLMPWDDVHLPREGRYRIRCFFNFKEGQRPKNVKSTTEPPPPPLPQYEQDVVVKISSEKPIPVRFEEKDRKSPWL